MPGPKLQFAFQGGGAKFVAMLPIAAAIRKLAAEDKISISALAGTSAGAICAALIAAECDFEKLIGFLREHGSERIKALREPLPDIDKIRPTVEDIKNNISSINFYDFRSWRRISSWKASLSENLPFLKSVIFEGNPALSSDAIEEFITELFSYCALDVTKGRFSVIENYTDPRLYIAASDVVAGQGVLASGNLRRGVIDSCSIPFALRSFNYLSESNLVDGGLCNNLPVDYLLSDPSVPSFLVYPEEVEKVKRPSIRNFISYSLSVVSCPIDYNVKRAKNSVEEAFHMPVYVDFSTFDFEAAIRFIKDKDAYDQVYNNALQKLSNFVSTYGQMHGKTDIRVTDTRSITDYAEMLDIATKNYEKFLRLQKCSLMVHVNEDARGDPSPRRADNVTMRTEFEVSKDGFRFYRSSLKRDKDGMTPSIWYAKNATKQYKNLPIRVLSIEKDNKSVGFQKCVVEFLTSESDISVGDVIHIVNVTYRLNDMAGLNRGKNEYILIENPHSQNYPIAEVRCRYPLSLGNFIFQIDDSKSAVRSADVDHNDHDAEQDGQFRTLVCAGKNLPAGEKFRVEIISRA